MAIFFWESKGVLMVELIQRGSTITSKVYLQMLKNCIKPITQNNRHGMLTYSVVPLHDNAHLLALKHC
jgi:hypothetical protein